VNFPLRIFITSRKVPDLNHICRSLEPRASIISSSIFEIDTISDIERYIQTRMDDLPVDTIEKKQEVAKKMLQQSSACFLWVRMVLDELMNVYATESMLQVLDGIPEGMVPYYRRVVQEMDERKKHDQDATKAILRWVVLSSRKMTVAELSQALELDLGIVLPKIEDAIEGLCGQLVTIGKDSNTVDIVHPTVAELLLSHEAGTFAIAPSEAHGRISLACLNLLCSNELRPPRNPRTLTLNQANSPPFLEYALTQFSEHLFSALGENEELLTALDRFFRTNVLSWVERIALKGNLKFILRALKNLRAYIDRLPQNLSDLRCQVTNIEDWLNDLSRLVTRFGTVLLQNPSTIHFLIPPLCPSGSTIYRYFGRRSRGLSVVGFHPTQWEDCIATNSLGGNVVVDIACRQNLIALGMESGDINLYDAHSYEEAGVLRGKDPVDLVHFADKAIAVCTIRSVRLQDLDGNIIWETRLRVRCVSLCSSSKAVISVTAHGHVTKWSISTGALIGDQELKYTIQDARIDENAPVKRAPFIASISPDYETAVTAYAGGAVCLWELATGELIGRTKDNDNSLAAAVLFNANPSIHLLLVIYSNHSLSLYDTWSATIVKSHKRLNYAGLLSAACSPDGRTLVTVDTYGKMNIWDFKSLSLLHQISTTASSYRLLEFTSDGISVLDVDYVGLHIWSPAALFRNPTEEPASIDEQAIISGAAEGRYGYFRNSRIMVFYAHPVHPIVFAGNFGGQILAFSTKTGERLSVLNADSSYTSITNLAISRSDVLASSDSVGTVKVWKLKLDELSKKESAMLLLSALISAPVKQLCFSASGDYLLVSTPDSDILYCMKDVKCIGAISVERRNRKVCHWFQSSDEGAEQHFTLLADHELKSYKAPDFSEVTSEKGIHLNYELSDATRLRTAFMHSEMQTLILEIRDDSRSIPSSSLYMYDLSQISTSASPMVLDPIESNLTKHCKHFVGFSNITKSILFLDKSSWIDSIGVSAITQKAYTQHFFVPNEYLLDGYDLLPIRTADDDIVFSSSGKLVIVKNGMLFRENRVFD
jgi:WD40 repeat protein